MRRRSERRKSADVSSPAPASRRTSRRSRKTPETSIEKDTNSDPLTPAEGTEKHLFDVDEIGECEDQTVEPAHKSRSQNRTTGKDHNSPAKRKSQCFGNDSKIDAIKEEDNFLSDESEKLAPAKRVENEDPAKKEVNPATSPYSPKTNVDDTLKPLDVLEIQAEDPDEEKLQSLDTLNKKDKRNAEDGPQCVKHLNNSNQPQQLDSKKCNPAEGTSQETLDKEYASRDEPSSSNTATNKCEVKTRKRKWITKKAVERKVPVVSISTDSLKNLISDVHPVPLSDVQLESSSEVEEILSEREEGEETPSPEREIQRISAINMERIKRNQNVTIISSNSRTKAITEQRSPSPPHNKASNILYITNLVRPFTVLQLKGLLARTGKIVEGGFWIDRIKSKCFVQYETEDEATETRHALHGVRWPVSNPKCLNVDFGIKADMERAIQTSKDELSKFGQENHKDNLIVGTGWSRDRNGDEKKSSRPVREWDVGKKENLERDKVRDTHKRRSRDRDTIGNHESERNGRERKTRSKGRGDQRSRSPSPVRKVKKKENDPPLRLLDDLFRKTKATPCVYWLPLTPEQIAEKEAFRQKRLEEHKQRVKLRELEKGKEREKDRNRAVERNRERERDHRRKRSSDRRSRSRDRRRY